MRTQTSSVAAFLTPSVASRCPSTRRCPYTSASRAFTTSAPRHAGPKITTTAAPVKNGNEIEAAEIQEKVQSLWGKPLQRDRTTRFSSPAAQRANRASSFNSSRPDVKNPVDSSQEELLAAFNREYKPRNSTGLGFANMVDPTPNSATDLMSDISAMGIGRGPPAVRPPPMRLNASTGRTVMINQNGGVDLGRGFTLLAQNVARNKIRAEFNKQRFHERPGLKRKRLRSERWRKRFMVGFKAAVGRVKILKRQGW